MHWFRAEHNILIGSSLLTWCCLQYCLETLPGLRLSYFISNTCIPITLSASADLCVTEVATVKDVTECANMQMCDTLIWNSYNCCDAALFWQIATRIVANVMIFTYAIVAWFMQSWCSSCCTGNLQDELLKLPFTVSYSQPVTRALQNWLNNKQHLNI